VHQAAVAAAEICGMCESLHMGTHVTILSAVEITDMKFENLCAEISSSQLRRKLAGTEKVCQQTLNLKCESFESLSEFSAQKSV
jgi:hypothetical protein